MIPVAVSSPALCVSLSTFLLLFGLRSYQATVEDEERARERKRQIKRRRGSGKRRKADLARSLPMSELRDKGPTLSPPWALRDASFCGTRSSK